MNRMEEAEKWEYREKSWSYGAKARPYTWRGYEWRRDRYGSHWKSSGAHLVPESASHRRVDDAAAPCLRPAEMQYAHPRERYVPGILGPSHVYGT